MAVNKGKSPWVNLAESDLELLKRPHNPSRFPINHDIKSKPYLLALYIFLLCFSDLPQLKAQDDLQSPDSLEKKNTAKRIEPTKEYEKGIKLAQLHKRPMLVLFGADWCNWCRKLESELATDDANEILEQWIIAKVDVDEEADIAREMHATALPALRILGPEMTIVASKEGYLPIAELKEWLKENALLADPKIQRVLYESGSLKSDDVKKLIEFLGHRSASIRSAAQKRLSGSRDESEGMVVDALRGGRLAQQLCALQILQTWQAPVESVDPWRPATINPEVAETLVQWLRREGDKGSAVAEGEIKKSPLDEAKVSDLMARLLASRTGNREGLMAEAVSFGDALIPEVRLRLADAGELDDSNRTLLRELLYRLLVGDRLRLEKSSLLVALASFNGETHRSAALSLLEGVTSQDQPMVDELSLDTDALVRESTVSKLQELGELQTSERLQRMLADKSPSVRTAVLRQLSEHPQDTSIAKLIEYTDRETDEDLLVYATKTLGLLGSQAGADEALIRLARNVSWRVRAAALDSMGQVFEEKGSHYGMSKQGKGDEKSTAEMAKVILEAAQDTDAFVVERAVAMVPKIIGADTAVPIMEFFAKNPKRLASLDKVLTGWRADETLKPLVSEAERWLDSKEAEKIEPAVNILTKIQPSALKLRIPDLLSSEIPLVRIGALKAAIASFAEFREERIAGAGVATVSPRSKPGDRKPWHEVPESFKTFPKAMAGAEDNANDNASKADAEWDAIAKPLGDDEIVMAEDVVPVQVPGVELLDDFFGTAKPAETKVETKSKPLKSVDEVLSLFGDPPATKEPTTESDVDPSELSMLDLFGESEKVDTEEPIGDSSEIQLPSEWLARWQNDYKFDWRSDWALEIRKKLLEKPQLANAENDELVNVENELVVFARLASGEANDALSTLQCLAAVNEPLRGLPTRHKELKLKDVIAWLPAKERVGYVTSQQFDWRTSSKKEGADYLDAATMIDDFAIAEWIFNGVRELELTDSQWALVRKYLMRALLGARADSIANYFGSSEVRARDVFSQLKMKLPRMESAIEWLGEHYKMDSNDATKGMLLSALSYMDHGLAVQSAIGRIAEATEWTPSVRMALAIALWDQSETSVDRAVQWLEHPVQDVRRACLNRLTQTVSDFSGAVGDLQTITFYDYQDKMPGFWYLQRSMSEKVLGEFALEEAGTARQARLLLLAIGKWKLSELDYDTSSAANRLRVAVALVKAKRADSEAVAFYQKCVDELMEDDDVGDFYRLIRSLDGDDVATIRATMRKRFSASALSN